MDDPGDAPAWSRYKLTHIRRGSISQSELRILYHISDGPFRYRRWPLRNSQPTTVPTSCTCLLKQQYVPTGGLRYRTESLSAINTAPRHVPGFVDAQDYPVQPNRGDGGARTSRSPTCDGPMARYQCSPQAAVRVPTAASPPKAPAGRKFTACRAGFLRRARQRPHYRNLTD